MIVDVTRPRDPDFAARREPGMDLMLFPLALPVHLRIPDLEIQNPVIRNRKIHHHYWRGNLAGANFVCRRRSNPFSRLSLFFFAIGCMVTSKNRFCLVSGFWFLEPRCWGLTRN